MKFIIIVLINGCFHNGPVICPRLVIMTQGRLYWPEGWRSDIFMIFYIMSSFIFLVGGIFMNKNLKCYTEFFNFGICFICTCIDVFTKRGGY